MPYVWGKEHFAGPDLDGSNKQSFSASGKTTHDVLAGLGFHFRSVEKVAFADGIEAARFIWPLLDIDETGGATFLAAAAGYRKQKNETLSTEDQPAYHNQPAQTWHRHMMDALRHMAVQYRYGTIGGEYVGDSTLVCAAYASAKGPSPYGNWTRFNRGSRHG